MKRFIPFGIVAAVIIVVVGVGYKLHSNIPRTNTSAPVQTNNQTNVTKTKKPMMGQNSFGLSVCDEVPKSLVEKVLGKKVEVTEDVSLDSGDGCNYFTDKTKDQMVLVQVSFLSIETQKKGLADRDITIAVNNDIPMENFISRTANGVMDSIFLVMAPNKFTSLDSTPGTTDDTHMIELAKEVTKIITGN